MTLEAQRIAIAEACGWKWSRTREGENVIFRLSDPRSGGRGTILNPQEMTDEEILVQFIPDYLYDLNAMHEAEKVLTTDSQKDNYHDAICDVLIGGSSFRWTDTFSVITATATERATAFLRTLGLWKE